MYKRVDGAGSFCDASQLEATFVRADGFANPAQGEARREGMTMGVREGGGK